MVDANLTDDVTLSWCEGFFRIDKCSEKQKKIRQSTKIDCRKIVVRAVGLEPTRLSTTEPKSVQSTDSSMPAYLFFNFSVRMTKCKTFPEVTSPKSPESTNSTMPAYSVGSDCFAVFQSQSHLPQLSAHLPPEAAEANCEFHYVRGFILPQRDSLVNGKQSRRRSPSPRYDFIWTA